MMENKTCLVVDDSSVVRKICRPIMENLGFTVNEAADGKEALESCNKIMPSVILLDWNMPVMDGLAFLKAFFEDKQKNGVKVIFCTTENDMAKIMEAMAAGADEYIMKPFDADIIENKLRQMGII
ncbi:response regulator [Rickettsiales bacterium]|nr:response regulator [Rickettsiales bacterium]